ncbi:MAG: xylulokinase [Kiritimatiellia bacterium]
MFTLGIDSSTQGIKALVYDTDAQAVVTTVAVGFGRELPEFGCPDGFLPNADALVRQADPQMWLAGLDRVLAKLQAAFDPSKIAAIGGDAQQHGSVYLNAGWASALSRLRLGASGGERLTDVFAHAFARPVAPIWMDSSTGAEVAELNRRFPDMAARTGSPAIERFTGPQIMKFAQDDPAGYANTVRIHLVSSFLCSVLVGEDAPTDIGDGSGMNLLDLRTLAWDEELCAAVAPGLRERLPGVAVPGAPLRRGAGLAAYFARYGLTPGIPVVPFTGDNPASLVGTGADRPGVAVISLGTSDVFFAAMDRFQVDPDGCGHVFGNPSGGCMSLACVKNGSLAREKVRAMVGCDYAYFDEGAFDAVRRGAGSGKCLRAFPYFEAEITPKHPATGIEAAFDWERASDAEKIVSIIRGQVLNLFERTRWIGKFDVIRVTGGASRSQGIRESIAEIFGAKVETLDVPDSAALGGALLAARCAAGEVRRKECGV